MAELKKYKPYELYGDTHAIWYKQKPAHWVCERFKYNFREKKKKKATELPAGSISFGEVIFKNENNLSHDTKESYQEVLAGEFLINPLNLNFDLKSLRTALSTINVVVSTGYIVLQDCGLLHSRFARWLLQQFDVSHMKTLGAGVRQTINYADIGNSIFCRPTLKEQKVIAAFLDHETAKIDTLIEKQQQLIELLKEKRQAVISHAVTKGLNPDVLMKDSGVEWLGEVPEHWKIKRCKNLFDFVTSGSRGWAGFYSDEGDLFFRIANLTRDSINPKLDSIQYVTPPKGSEGERSKIKENDLLISITADLGSVCAADESISGGYVSQHVSLCRPGRLVASSRWLAYFVLSDTAKEQLQGAGYGGTKVQLSLEDIRDLFVAYPPKSEQIKIASYLDERLSELDGLDHRAHNLIELLRERRTALITAAVTGKIDVRDWVAPDTQDVEEPQEATA